jgi:uncharacterized protein
MDLEKQNTFISETVEYVKKFFSQNTDGHDWWHTYRVWQLAIKIRNEEKKGNTFIIETESLLHDIDDWKLTGNTELLNTEKWLSDYRIDKIYCDQIYQDIKNISFKGANVMEHELSWEGKIVQDADRLDAIGAIGTARAFAYGGSKHRSLFNPEAEPNMHGSYSEYKNSDGCTIHHFYEKLLLLKDRMNTETARKMAEKRHQFMQNFLKQFNDEWNVKE